MTTSRVLVTGGRAYRDREKVRSVLDDAHQRLGPFVLVHGYCETGADHFADEWAADHASSGVLVERHPADWVGPCRAECKPGHRARNSFGGTYCPAAGPYRNADMVGLGAEECHAFLNPGSRGGARTAGLAKTAGIRTHVHKDLPR